jgi:hypothetical protein
MTHDIADIIAGELGVSRGTAYDMMREVLKEASPAQEPMHPEIKKMYEDYFDKCFREFSAPQPVPVKTYHDGKPWPVQPKPWVGLTDEEMYLNCPNWLSQEQCKAWIQQIEAKLKEKNHDQ